MKRILALLGVGALALAACVPSGDGPSAPPSRTVTPSPDGPNDVPRSAVGAQLFMFPWDSVAAQCRDVLGPAGYGWVLVSPPQEHIRGDQWWVHYQPVSYQISSRLGTRQQFADMVRACKAAGVKVMADVVINHMTGQESGTGWAGSSFKRYEYPDLYEKSDFHYCTLTADMQISGYSDPREVQTCELRGMADLKTSSTYVQGRLRAYMADLVLLGVDGVRLGSAKYVAPSDIQGIISGLPNGLRIVQEVARVRGEPVQPEQYLTTGDVLEYSYGRDIAKVVQFSYWSLFQAMGQGSLYLPSSGAVPFVANHDTERDGSTLSYKDGANYQLANVLMILHGYGTPIVYSGYSFSNRDQGPPLENDGRVKAAQCVEGWQAEDAGKYVCAHSWPLVRAAVRFAAVAGKAPAQFLYLDGDVVGLKRGGAVAAVNRGDKPAEVTISTGLKEGEYCDLAAGEGCNSRVVVRSFGEAKMVVPAKGAIILTELDLASSLSSK